jgi:L-xylulokinase
MTGCGGHATERRRLRPAHSAIWAQRFADITGRTIEVSAVQEVGAAAIAGVGIGAFPDFTAGVAALNPARATFTPGAALEAHYGRRFVRYRAMSGWLARVDD